VGVVVCVKVKRTLSIASNPHSLTLSLYPWSGIFRPFQTGCACVCQFGRFDGEKRLETRPLHYGTCGCVCAYVAPCVHGVSSVYGEDDSQIGMLVPRDHPREGTASWPSAECVQRFDDSRSGSAIHISYRSWLRSSSMRKPRYPLLRVVCVCVCVCVFCVCIKDPNFRYALSRNRDRSGGISV